MQKDKYFIVDLVAKNPNVFKHIRKEFKKDGDVVLSAISPKMHDRKTEKEKCSKAFKYICQTLKADKEFTKKCLDSNGFVRKYLKG